MAVFASDGWSGLPDLIPNDSKILEAILLVIEKADSVGEIATQFDIAKTIFLADLRHLKDYGRPITFDNFFAMEFGPVPSRTYDMLKPSFAWSSLEMDGPPWHSSPIDAKTRKYTRPSRSSNRKRLSETDISLLEKAFGDVKSMGFKKTSDVTHKLPAYIKAWDARGMLSAKKMDLRLLLPDFDSESIKGLEFASKYSS